MKRKGEESKKKAQELTNLYYGNEIGYEPLENVDRQITEYTVQYLVESKLSDETIMNALLDVSKHVVTPESLPDWLWKDSLIKRNQFYTNRLFHLESDRTRLEKLPNGARVLITSPDFWLEIIPRFTLEQLIGYYYANLPNVASYNTDKQDIGVFQYLLQRYDKLAETNPYVTSLDLIVTGIDKAAAAQAYLADPFELTKIIDEMIPETIRTNKIGFEQGKCKIIWRSHKLTPSIPQERMPYDFRRKPGYNV